MRMDAADLSAALLEARPSRADADAVMAELQPIFAQHGYQLELVGSLTKGEFGKDIDFLLKPGAPGTTIEAQMKVFYDEIAPVLEEMRWTVYNSPSDRPDGSWFVTAVSPADHVVDIFMTGPFGYDSVAESDLIHRASIADESDQRTAQGEAQAQAERERPVSEATITHRLRVISGHYVRESEPEEDDVNAGEFLKQKMLPSGILSALGFKQLETNEDVWFKVFPPAKDSSYHRDRMIWVEPYEHPQPGENLFNVEGNMANTANTEWIELSVMRRVPLSGLEDAIRKVAKIIESSEAQELDDARILEAKALAPVRFFTVMPGFPTNAWFKPTQPFPTPDDHTYQPNDNISLMKLMRWGYQIPPTEYQKFIAAGGQAGGENRVIRTEAVDDADVPDGGLLSYFKSQSLADLAAKVKTIPFYVDGGQTDDGTWRAYFTNAQEGVAYCWWVCLDMLDRESVRMAWLLAYPSTASGGTADRDFPPAEVIPQIKGDFDNWLIDFKRGFPGLLIHVEWITSHLLPESEEDDIDHAAFAKSTITPAAALARRGFRQSKNRPEAWIKHIYRNKQRPCIIIALLVPERPGKYLVVGAVKNSPPLSDWKEVVARASEPVRLAEVTREVEILLRGQKYPVQEAEDDFDPKEFLSGLEVPEKVLQELGFRSLGPVTDIYAWHWTWSFSKGKNAVNVRRLPSGQWEIMSFLIGNPDGRAVEKFPSYALRAGLEWAYPPFAKWWRPKLPESAEPTDDINPDPKAYLSQVVDSVKLLRAYGLVPEGSIKDFWMNEKERPMDDTIFVHRIGTEWEITVHKYGFDPDPRTRRKRFSIQNLEQGLNWAKYGTTNESSEDPTDAQKEAGNYKKRHLRVLGFDISIENEKDGIRSGTAPNGEKWEVKMPCAYGYLKGTEGKDGDHVDVYVNEPVDETASVFVLDQKDADTGKFDEHKCFLFFKDEDSVKAVYDKAFDDGKAKDRIGAITKLSLDEFKTWLEDGDTTKKLDGQEVTVAEAVKPTPIHCGQCGANLHAPDSVGKSWLIRMNGLSSHDISVGHFDYAGKFIEDAAIAKLPPGSQLEPMPGAFSCLDCGEPVSIGAEPPLAEAIDPDDIDPKDYLAHVKLPPSCANCGERLTDRMAVWKAYVENGTDRVMNLGGHYDLDSEFITDEEPPVENWDDYTSLGAESETCARCGKHTGMIGESVHEAEEADDSPDPKQYIRSVFNLEHFLTEHGFDLEDESGRYRKFVKYYQLPQPYAITPTLKANFLVVQILLDRNHSKFNAVIVGCGSQRQLYGALTLREYNLAKKHRSGRADMDMTARRFVNGIDNAIGEINWPRNSSVIALQGAVAAKLGKFIEQVNFNESLDDIDDPENYVKDYERILVPFTTKEDCKFLSDRWGDAEYSLSDEEKTIVDELVPFMIGEESFIVIRNGIPGILFEQEIMNPAGDDEEHVVTDCWNGRCLAYDDVKKIVLTRATRAQQYWRVNAAQKYPNVEWYVTQGSHVVQNRFAIRAFFPRPTGALPTDMLV
jgi:hypothetical protein